MIRQTLERPELLNRNRLDLTIAGILLFLVAAIVLMGIITAEMFYPAGYSTSHNEISDLGATRPPNSVITQPSATIFDTSMFIAGILILISTFFVFRTYKDLVVVLPLCLLGLGVLGVGIFHGDSVPMHPIVSLITFISGGIAAICSYRIIRSPLKFVAVILGLMTLFFLFGSDLFIPTLGMGGVERWVVYPVVIWMFGLGGYLLGMGSKNEANSKTA